MSLYNVNTNESFSKFYTGFLMKEKKDILLSSMTNQNPEIETNWALGNYLENSNLKNQAYNLCMKFYKEVIQKKKTEIIFIDCLEKLVTYITKNEIN